MITDNAGFTLIVFLLLLGFCLPAILFVNDSVEAGATVEMVNSGGVCGEYLGYKGGHIVRDSASGLLYASDNQAVIVVESCGDKK